MFFILDQDPVGQGCVPRRRKHDDQQDLEDRNTIAAHVNSRLAQGSGQSSIDIFERLVMKFLFIRFCNRILFGFCTEIRFFWHFWIAIDKIDWFNLDPSLNAE